MGVIKKGLGKTLENIQQGTTQNGSLENQLTVTEYLKLIVDNVETLMVNKMQ